MSTAVISRTEHPTEKPGQRPLRLFIGCAPEDDPLCEALVKHLSGLRHGSLLSLWCVLDLAPGENLELRTRAELDRADIAVLLLSSDYLASESCMVTQLDYATKKGVHILPVLARPVDLRGTDLDGVATLPLDGTAVSDSRNQDATWTQVAQHLHSLVEAGIQRPSTRVIAPAVESVDASPPPSSRRTVRRPRATTHRASRERTGLRIAATFSGAGAVAGFTLEVTHLNSILLLGVFLLLLALLLGWATKALLAALRATTAGAAGPASGGAAGAGAGLSGGAAHGASTSIVGALSAPAKVAGVLVSSLGLATGSALGVAQVTATMSGLPAYWPHVFDPNDILNQHTQAPEPTRDSVPVHLTILPSPPPTSSSTSESSLFTFPTASASASVSSAPRAPPRTTRMGPPRVARVDFGSSVRFAALRNGPSRLAEKLTGVPKGSEVTLLGESLLDRGGDGGVWYRVAYNGTIGWLHANTLTGE